MIAPVRETGSAFADALNCSVASPCPLWADVMVNHPASAEAVHWHSRSVRTAMLPLPPGAGTWEAGRSRVTVHFAATAGAVTV